MKRIYLWVIISFLLAGFIVMSLILIQGIYIVRELLEQFIEFIRGILP